MPSPNFGPRPASAHVDLIVIHSISLPPGEFGNGLVQSLFMNQLDWNAHPYFGSIRDIQVSAHFFITRRGELWQFVSCNERAWHAGQSRYRGRDNCNDDSIGIELEGLEGEGFESAQYETLASLCAVLMSAYPIAHLAGHEHIAPGRKYDPGSKFNWLQLERATACPKAFFPC
jgi:N-acetyl-anhydromuramoyl-L-alanine amidase